MELPETFRDDQPRIPDNATLKPQNLFHSPPVTQHYGFVDLADGMKHVEIAIDQSGTKFWVNVNGVCVCRVQNIEELVVGHETHGDNECSCDLDSLEPTEQDLGCPQHGDHYRAMLYRAEKGPSGEPDSPDVK